MVQLGSHRAGLHERHVWLFLESLSRISKFDWNLTRITGTLREEVCTFMIISRSILLFHCNNGYTTVTRCCVYTARLAHYQAEAGRLFNLAFLSLLLNVLRAVSVGDTANSPLSCNRAFSWTPLHNLWLQSTRNTVHNLLSIWIQVNWFFSPTCFRYTGSSLWRSYDATEVYL
jgi:hypothetical protein